MDVIIQKDQIEDIAVKLVRKHQLLVDILKDILHFHYFVIFIPEKDILDGIPEDIPEDIPEEDIQDDIQKNQVILKKGILKEDYLVYFYFNIFLV